jgi:hypothetical protein
MDIARGRMTRIRLTPVGDWALMSMEQVAMSIEVLAILDPLENKSAP